MKAYFKKLMKSTFTQWIMLFAMASITFAVLDSLFGVVSDIGFLGIGFIAFIILWCEKQDKIGEKK